MLEVEVIEREENEIHQADEILSMLLPNQLKRATMQFLEVDDIRYVGAMPPKSRLEEEYHEDFL